MVFQGREIINGNENSHSWLENGHLDYYSETKHQAEKIIIQSSNKLTKNKTHVLRTCVLRYVNKYVKKWFFFSSEFLRIILRTHIFLFAPHPH